MDAEKRKVIVREIEQWRRSRLLPEHYCDFLMNLYVDESTEKPKSMLGVSAKSITNSNWKNWIIGLLVIVAISFAALNFNSFGIPLQIGVSLLFVLICYVIGFLNKSRSPVITPFLCGVASISLLFIGVYLLDLHGITNPTTYVAYVALCSLVWMLTGLLGKMSVFHFCGWIGLLSTYGWMLYKKLQEPTWGILEIGWVPISLIFIWIAWLVHHKNKQAAAVLLAVGCITFFAPEGYGLLVEGTMSMELVQSLLLGKMIVMVSLLFTLRKKWVEWVM